MHLDEATRSLARDFVKDSLATLRERGEAEWTWSGARVQLGIPASWELVLPRAARLAGSRRAVRYMAPGVAVQIQAPAGAAPMREQISVFERCLGGGSAEKPGRIVEEALERWALGLDSPIDAFEATQTYRAMHDLLLGALVDSPLNWTWARAYPSAKGGAHHMSVGLKGRGSSFIEFRCRGSDASGARMSDELAEAFDGIVGDVVHVSEGHARDASQMPTIVIGAPPSVMVRNDADAMARLTARACLPTGARLIL